MPPKSVVDKSHRVRLRPVYAGAQTRFPHVPQAHSFKTQPINNGLEVASTSLDSSPEESMRRTPAGHILVLLREVQLNLGASTPLLFLFVGSGR